MALQHAGTRLWTEALLAAYAGPVVPGTGVSLGGEIHDSLIPAEIKPGTRAYLLAMRNLGGPVEPPEPGVQLTYADDVYEPDVYE